MRGRRIPDGEFHHGPPREAGDYGLSGGGLWVVLPSGVCGRLHADPATGWTWSEQDDGTLTVSPSIHDAPHGWHGYLERGCWRSV